LEKRGDCGRWGLVGGGIEVEGSLEEAARREKVAGLDVIEASRPIVDAYSDPPQEPLLENAAWNTETSRSPAYLKRS